MTFKSCGKCGCNLFDQYNHRLLNGKKRPVLYAGYCGIRAFKLLERDEILARPIEINRKEQNND